MISTERERRVLLVKFTSRTVAVLAFCPRCILFTMYFVHDVRIYYEIVGGSRTTKAVDVHCRIQMNFSILLLQLLNESIWTTACGLETKY